MTLPDIADHYLFIYFCLFEMLFWCTVQLFDCSHIIDMKVVQCFTKTPTLWLIAGWIKCEGYSSAQLGDSQ